MPWANDLKTALGGYSWDDDGEFVMECESNFLPCVEFV